jgi:glucose-6-phosphate 1-epimerase
VTLYGAHLVSWISGDGKERLFCSARSALDGSRAIRGGVPVIFPQFAERGTGMRHGFARVSTWRLADSGMGEEGAFAVFALTRRDLSQDIAAQFPHGFELRLKVALEEQRLTLGLDVRNTGDDEFAFSAALHTYLAVSALDSVTIHGVREETLAFAGKHDEIYRNVQGSIAMANGGGQLLLNQSSFTDAVVWNPGAADSAKLSDMDDDEFQRFVCIEPAVIEPLTLKPGGAWRGDHTIEAA